MLNKETQPQWLTNLKVYTITSFSKLQKIFLVISFYLCSHFYVFTLLPSVSFDLYIYLLVKSCKFLWLYLTFETFQTVKKIQNFNQLIKSIYKTNSLLHSLSFRRIYLKAYSPFLRWSLYLLASAFLTSVAVGVKELAYKKGVSSYKQMILNTAF